MCNSCTTSFKVVRHDLYETLFALAFALPNSIKSVKVKAEMPRPAWDDDALLWALGGGRQAADDEYQEKVPHPILYYRHSLYTNLALLLIKRRTKNWLP